jgi:hypothetical protein
LGPSLKGFGIIPVAYLMLADHASGRAIGCFLDGVDIAPESGGRHGLHACQLTASDDSNDGPILDGLLRLIAVAHDRQAKSYGELIQGFKLLTHW